MSDCLMRLGFTPGSRDRFGFRDLFVVGIQHMSIMRLYVRILARLHATRWSLSQRTVFFCDQQVSTEDYDSVCSLRTCPMTGELSECQWLQADMFVDVRVVRENVSRERSALSFV